MRTRAVVVTSITSALAFMGPNLSSARTPQIPDMSLTLHVAREPGLPLTSTTLSGNKGYGHVDVSGLEGIWVYPLIRVRLSEQMNPALRAEVLKVCPFLDDVDPYTLQDIDPSLPPSPAIIVPENDLNTITGATLVSPLSDDLVRYVYQPITAPATGDVNTRRWSASPPTWMSTNPTTPTGHDGHAIGQARIDWWSEFVVDPADPTYLDLGLLMERVVDDQARATTSNPYDPQDPGPWTGRHFFDRFPTPETGFDTTRTWYYHVSLGGGVRLEIQFIGLRSAALTAGDVTADEITTAGLKALEATPPAVPILPVPVLSNVAVVTFGGHGGQGSGWWGPPRPQAMIQTLSLGGEGYIDASRLYGTPVIAIQDSATSMYVAPLSWQEPGHWTFTASGQMALGPGTYLSVKNPDFAPHSLVNHPSAAVTITDS